MCSGFANKDQNSDKSSGRKKEQNKVAKQV